MTITERFSTVDINVHERMSFWDRIGIVNNVPVDIRPQPADLFNGALTVCSLGSLSVARVTMTPPHGQSWEIALHDPEHVFVQLQDHGASDLEQDGKRVRLDAGALTVLLGSQPYSISIDKTTRFLVLKLPLSRVAARVGDLARLVGTSASASDSALLSSFLHTLLAQEEVARRPGRDEAVGDVLLDLVALTYHGVPIAPAPRASLGERWQQTVRDFVDRHLGEPELGATMIAERLGVTPRYVQMVFASLGTTASAYVSGRRLELAATLLQRGGEQVSDVAFRVGFADLSYFYRSFRKRFGVSPKRYIAR